MNSELRDLVPVNPASKWIIERTWSPRTRVLLAAVEPSPRSEVPARWVRYPRTRPAEQLKSCHLA